MTMFVIIYNTALQNKLLGTSENFLFATVSPEHDTHYFANIVMLPFIDIMMLAK